MDDMTDPCEDYRDALLDGEEEERNPHRCRAHVEQLCKGWVQHSRKHKRDLKRQAHKLMRRIGRMFLDDAPRRLPIRGYSD